MKSVLLIVAFATILLTSSSLALQCKTIVVVDRRRAMDMGTAAAAAALSLIGLPLPTVALDEQQQQQQQQDVAYELRNRNGNKDALIREDWWYFSGKMPPRKLASLVPDDPKWNVWGSCQTTSGANSCTYVPLKQRIPAYSKYAFNIALGAKEYQQVGNLLKQIRANNNDNDNNNNNESVALWNQALTMVNRRSSPSLPPPPAVDALLKMILFASAMLTTPNYSGPQRDVLVSRFYVNEVHFAMMELTLAIDEHNIHRASKAWEFGKDSWNSYLNIVNPSIVPKVGEPIPLIQ